MPKELIDSSKWESTTVPVGTDPANAASVEMPFQQLTNRDRYLYEQVGRLQLLNWREDPDFSRVSSSGTVYSACYDETTGVITAVMGLGTTPYSMESADGGMTWRDGVDPKTGGPREPLDVASDGNGTRIAVHHNVRGPIVYHDGAKWQPSTIVEAPRDFLRSCGGARNSSSSFVFMVAGDSGRIFRSEDGRLFADCSPTGLWGETIHVIAHTKSLFGADQWVAITDSYAASSSDGGDSWRVGKHGLSVTEKEDSLFWDDSRSIWLLLLGGKGVAESSDGVRWKAGTELPRLVPNGSLKIVGDGEGKLLAAACSYRAGVLFGSCDGGQSWFDIDTKDAPPNLAASKFAIAYGRGRFSIIWNNSELSGLFSLAL